MELETPRASKGATPFERLAGPIFIAVLSIVIAAACQLGIFYATGYSRTGAGALLVSTPKTAELLLALGVMQLVALAIALVLLALTNMLDPGSVELNQLPGVCTSSEEGAESGKRKNGRAVKTMPDGSEIEFRWCWHCAIWRPPTANHCPTCQRCFLALDHHCPWTGNCIAAHNIRFFWLMLASFGVAGLMIPLGLLSFFASALINHDHVHTAVLVVGILFAAYLVCMFGGMWVGASVMLGRAVKTILNPRRRLSPNSEKGQAELFDEMLSRQSAQSQSCCMPVAPCRCRQH